MGATSVCDAESEISFFGGFGGFEDCPSEGSWDGDSSRREPA